MSKEITAALDVLIKQYPRLGYVTKDVPGISDPVFTMPKPVPPHKRGDIVISAFNTMDGWQPNHCHDYFLINYAYDGNYEMNIDGKDVVLQEGSVCVYQPLVSHAILPHKSANNVLLAIRIRKRLLFNSLLSTMPKNEDLLDFFLSPLWDKPTDPHYYIMFSGDAMIKASMRNIFEILIMEYVDMQPGYDTLLDSAVTMLFALLSRCNRLNTFNRKSASDANGIIQYIKRNCTSVTLEQAAQKYSYNPNYLSALLHKKTGKTFSELLRGFKLEQACTLLKHSNLSVEEIAFLSGYPHNSNFYKVFRDSLNMSPNQYRIQSREENKLTGGPALDEP